MHLDGRSRLRLGAASNRLCRWLAVLFPATLVGSAFGQGVLPPPPGFQGAPAVPAMGNVVPPSQNNIQNNAPANNQTTDQNNTPANGTANGPAAGAGALNGQGASSTGEAATGNEVTAAGPVAAPVSAVLGWGAMHIHPHASYQFVYATGVHTAPGVSEDTMTHTISPGVSVNLGPHVTADYTPSLRFYSQRDFHNTVDHSFSLNAANYIYGDWTFGVSQSAVITDEPVVQTSSQIQQQTYDTGLTASYEMNEKITLATTLSVELMNTSGGDNTNIFVGSTPSQLSDTQTYKGMETLDYKINDRFTGGLMAIIGYTEQSGGFQSVEEQYNVHLAWHPGAKLSATVSGGFEQRNFLNSKASAAWNPVYSADISYHAFEHTMLSLFANQSVSASIFDEQLSKSTTAGVGLEQRLLGKLHLTLGFGYSKTDYESTATTDLNSARSDEGWSYTAGLVVPFLQRCSFATFFQYNQNKSTQKGFSYDSSQIGATLSWSY